MMAHPISSDFLALQTALAGRYSLERELGRGGRRATGVFTIVEE